MATDADTGGLLRTLRRTSPRNAKLGRALAIIGVLSVLGGVGFSVATMTLPLDPAFVPIYRELAVGLAGYGLPAILAGLVVAQRGEAWVDYVSLLGVLACSFAVLLFVWTYPTRWNVAGGSGHVIAGLVSYNLGVMLCAFGVGGAAACPDARDGEEEFIWGNPPEN